MSLYDIKVYNGNEEIETIRDLKYSQMLAVVNVLDRYRIRYIIKEVSEE